MDTRQFLSLSHLEEMLNNPNFFVGGDSNDNIDIVELPPDNIDGFSDEEEIDENVLEDTQPKEVARRLEIHSNALPESSTSTESEPSSKIQKFAKSKSLNKIKSKI